MLSKEYDNLKKDSEYHITSFEWTSVLDIAEIVSEYFPRTKIYKAETPDMVQRDLRNEPDPEILKYWKPKTDIRSGVLSIIEKMKEQ